MEIIEASMDVDSFWRIAGTSEVGYSSTHPDGQVERLTYRLRVDCAPHAKRRNDR